MGGPHIHRTLFDEGSSDVVIRDLGMLPASFTTGSVAAPLSPRGFTSPDLDSRAAYVAHATRHLRRSAVDRP